MSGVEAERPRHDARRVEECRRSGCGKAESLRAVQASSRARPWREREERTRQAGVAVVGRQAVNQRCVAARDVRLAACQAACNDTPCGRARRLQSCLTSAPRRARSFFQGASSRRLLALLLSAPAAAMAATLPARCLSIASGLCREYPGSSDASGVDGACDKMRQQGSLAELALHLHIRPSASNSTFSHGETSGRCSRLSACN